MVILSNYSERELIDRGLKLGALEYLIKSQTTPAKVAGVPTQELGLARRPVPEQSTKAIKLGLVSPVLTSGRAGVELRQHRRVHLVEQGASA